MTNELLVGDHIEIKNGVNRMINTVRIYLRSYAHDFMFKKSYFIVLMLGDFNAHSIVY
jgi:hypothetical protein